MLFVSLPFCQEVMLFGVIDEMTDQPFRSSAKLLVVFSATSFLIASGHRPATARHFECLAEDCFRGPRDFPSVLKTLQ